MQVLPLLHRISMPATLARIVLLLVTAGPAFADALHDHDNAPLTGIFGLPDSTEGGDVASAGHIAWTVIAATSSHAISTTTGNEQLVFDGETSRLELRLRVGLGERFEAGIELPYVWQQSGSLDSLIDGWHDVFGLPDGARDELPQDDLRFLLREGSETRLDVRDNSHGVGDLRLFGAYRLRSGPRHRRALRFGLKFPTGSAEELHGSGGTDLSLGYAADIDALGGSERWSAFYRVHALRLGRPQWLADRYEEWVGQVSGGLSVDLSAAVSLGVQAGFRTALYDLQNDELGTPAVTLTFGGQLTLSDRWAAEFAVGEDIKVGSSPDVTFQLGLRYRPQ